VDAPPRRPGQPGRAGAPHRRGLKQYTSIAFTERLAAAGAQPSVGTVGDAYENALAGSVIGLYKTGLIKPKGPWRTADQVELATLDYVDWFNHRRLFGPAGTFHPPNSKPPTTVRTPASPRPVSQQIESPGSPGRFKATWVRRRLSITRRLILLLSAGRRR
jgi:transposase InsO family protein